MPFASAKSADLLPIGGAACLSDSGWHVVHTHVHSEAKAAAHLARQGYLAYLPRYLKKRRHARRTETVAAPLFPRYLFVSFDPQACRWRSIHSTVGVAHLVCNGDEPATVPAKVIEQLKQREDAKGFICLERRQFAPGARIEVVDGVFSSCFGLYEGMADSDRVRILLDLLGRKVRVVLDGDAIAAA